jgi:hypothetical protein
MGRWGASFKPAHLGLVALSIRLFESQTYGVYIDVEVGWFIPAAMKNDWVGRAVAAGLL